MSKDQICDANQDNEAINLKNANLFRILREEISSGNKQKQIVQCLKEGADLNGVDTASKNNTPLHIATIQGEVDIVKLLLDRGADASISNDDNLTVLDIIQLPETPNSTDLATILYKKYGYQKRRGTSGVRGELYETKLLSLILFRALYNENIKEFILGTNLDDIGALDDIIIRYNTNETEESKILFLQAKHRENETFTIDDLLNKKKEINIYKYFESYLRIRQKFVTDSHNTLFQGLIKHLDCKFVIYTSAKQYIGKTKNTENTNFEEIQAEENLIKASETGKIFKLKYDNESKVFNEFMSTASKIRAIALAQSLTKFLIQDNGNFKNMMLNNLIRQFHIYLAQNVIEIKDAIFDDATSNRSKPTDHLKGQFRSSFLTSTDENLQMIKLEICKELEKTKSLSPNLNQTELNRILQSLSFKLHLDFGNNRFSFIGSKAKQETRLTHMCSIFQKLFQNTYNSDSTYIYVDLDDDSVGPNEIVQSKDLENYWLGGLVGNLLMYDDDTEMLKFNFDEKSLSDDNIKILEKLKVTHDVTELSKFRFNVNFHNFPTLRLDSKPCKEYDRKVLKHFLSNLRIYTNQAKEDEVETVLKNEIYTLYNSRKKNPDLLFRIKCDAIFLTVHDNIQKWWKQPSSAPYLTETCKFYHQVEREILDSPLLSIINFICRKKINNTLLEFENEVINSINLNDFLNSTETLMVVFSNEISFSSMKVIQFFNDRGRQSDYIFINLDYEIIETCFEIILNELESSVTQTLIVMSQDGTDFNYRSLSYLTKTFKGKVIIITHIGIEDNFKIKCSQKSIYRDSANNFSNLSSKIRKMIHEEREIVFQGIPVNITSILSDYALDLFSPTLLLKILHNEKIGIGKTLNDRYHDKTVNNYVKRTISRIIALRLNKDINNELRYKEHGDADLVLEENKDIVLLTESEDEFAETCKRHNNVNVHWCTKMKKEGHIIWNKSRGSLETIIKYVDRSLPVPYAYQYTTNLRNLEYKLMTLNDIEDKILIINAEPGMGKSSLLTYLAINTKLKNPNLWILKINLLDNHFLDQLSNWKDSKTDINMVQVIMFLYSAIDKKYYTNNDIFMSISKLITMKNDNEIYFSDCDGKYLQTVDLTEIKLLNYFYNNTRLSVLLDGFDEICPDYTDEVIQLLNVLKISKVVHLWVTARPYNVLTKLELALGTFSFTLNPLNVREQIQFLQNEWSQKFCQNKPLDIRKKIYISIAEVYTVIIDALDNDRKFTSIPLNLYMIAEIYQNLLRKHIDYRLSSLSQEYMLTLRGIVNFITLYEKFTNIKFHMQFQEKNNFLNSKDPYIKKIKKDAHKLFIKNHKNIAAYLLLDRNIVLSDYDIESVQEFIDDIKSDTEKTGIIKCIDDNPKFVHYTFAEYFAVEFLFDKLKSDRSSKLIWQYMIDNILIINDKNGVRRFINSKLQRDEHIITYFKSKAEHMTIVFDILLNQFKNMPANAIFVAIEENFDHIATFLIECMKVKINENNLTTLVNLFQKKCNKSCIFCIAFTKRKQSIIKHLLELITEIPISNFETSNSSALNGDVCISLNSLLQLDNKTANTVATFLTKHKKSWLPTLTAHWALGTQGFLLTFCSNFILKLNVEQRLQLFGDKNFDGQSIKSQHIGKEYFNWVSTVGLSGKNEFINTCSTFANCDLKSVICLLKNILEKVYDKTDIDVEDFIFDKLPEIQSHFEANFERTISDQVKPYANLLSNLVLLRALCEDHIKEFILTHHMKELDAFDYIIMKYRTTDSQKSNMIFMQLQNVIDEDLLTLNEKSNILKYMKSYLQIKEIFRSNNENPLFQGNMNSIDCKFIIYTTTKGNFPNDIFFECVDQHSFIETSKDSKIFQYAYTNDDVDVLVSRLSKSRAKELGECIALFVFYNCSLESHLTKLYNNLIAENIIEIESSDHQSKILPDNRKHNYSIARFRSSFLTSNDETLRLIRNEIHKKLAKVKNLRLDSQKTEVEFIMKTLRFKLPASFGTQAFHFYGNEMEQQQKLNSLLSTFGKLFKNHSYNNGSDFTLIEFDDDAFSSDNSICFKDFVAKDGLAGLVGNLLIFDEETEMLKFNFNEDRLSSDNVKVIEGLKITYDVIQLSNFRFDINVHDFPKLSLNNKQYDRKLVVDFLNKLQFYTNQANIDEVEGLLKNDLNKYLNVLKKQNDFLFSAKCDAVFFSYLWWCHKYNDSIKCKQVYSTSLLL